MLVWVAKDPYLYIFTLISKKDKRTLVAKCILTSYWKKTKILGTCNKPENSFLSITFVMVHFLTNVSLHF
jgi:hypothetical protein